MSYIALDLAMRVEGVCGIERDVLVALAFFQDEETRDCFASLEAISEKMDRGINQVRKAVHSLSAKRLITVNYRYRKPSEYILHFAEETKEEENTTQSVTLTDWLPYPNGEEKERETLSPYNPLLKRKENKTPFYSPCAIGEDMSDKENGFDLTNATPKKKRKTGVRTWFKDSPFSKGLDPKWFEIAKFMELDPKQTYEDFVFYWMEGEGLNNKQPRKADWTATWRTWCRNKITWNQKRPTRQQPQTSSISGLNGQFRVQPQKETLTSRDYRNLDVIKDFMRN